MNQLALKLRPEKLGPLRLGLVFILGIALLSSCRSPENTQFQVVATTGMLGDAAQSLLRGADSVEVTTLMGPGVDPHLYKASQGDIESLAQADLILYNGLHLEGKMQDVFSRLRNRDLFKASEAIPRDSLINATEYAGAYDPHIWFDPLLWELVVVKLAEHLAERLPQHASLLAQRNHQYRDSLRHTHQWIRKQVQKIPEQQRIIITAHDAFKYLGQRYQLEVRGLQGISTTAEYGVRDIKNLADLIVENNIGAIFVESSVPKRSVEAVIAAAQSRGHEVQLGGELYSDALGPTGSGAASYLGMLRHNVKTLSQALR